MIFDKLCTMAERHLPDFIPLLKKTKLFEFPGRGFELLRKEYDEETINFFRDEFFLPFQYMAVEDTASCVCLFDKDKNIFCIEHLK